MIRVGLGTDKHRLSGGRKMILGGVPVNSIVGPVGHSDGDAAAHAIIDALLGAAALGDIGDHFPDSDPRWKGADSLELLKSTVELLREKGWRPANVDCSIHLERPKLKELKEEMAKRLAKALNLPRQSVNIKAKTGESVDSIGRGEAVESFAVALIEKMVVD
jgi:2-C-methyl-D-erythritol 2,4-cyclodiphosphate synthase